MHKTNRTFCAMCGRMIRSGRQRFENVVQDAQFFFCSHSCKIMWIDFVREHGHYISCLDEELVP